MRTIWKFPLKIIETQVITMPGLFVDEKKDVVTNGNILTIGVLNNQCSRFEQPYSSNLSPISLWALVDSDAPEIERTIHMFWTGVPCDCPYGDYVGTVVYNDLVYHVFVE